MGLRVSVDEDVHGATAAVLRDRGHDATSVAEAFWARAQPTPK